MAIDVAVVADSVNRAGGRILTLRLRYPRFIHAEFMTHRVFSRNASSSRAIPVARVIAAVEEEPVLPENLAANRAGMQPGERLSEEQEREARKVWQWHREVSIEAARQLSVIGVHKQWANRLLEPHAHITVVVTSTEWDNFFALRCSSEAQAEISELAHAMRRAMDNSSPKKLAEGEWHLPFVHVREHSLESSDPTNTLVRCSVARCARVSYLTHEGKEPDVEEDLKLADRLQASGHWSPFEHQAVARCWWSRSGNFRSGWVQYRQMVDGLHPLPRWVKDE